MIDRPFISLGNILIFDLLFGLILSRNKIMDDFNVSHRTDDFRVSHLENIYILFYFTIAKLT